MCRLMTTFNHIDIILTSNSVNVTINCRLMSDIKCQSDTIGLTLWCCHNDNCNTELNNIDTIYLYSVNYVNISKVTIISGLTVDYVKKKVSKCHSDIYVIQIDIIFYYIYNCPRDIRPSDRKFPFYVHIPYFLVSYTQF